MKLLCARFLIVTLWFCTRPAASGSATRANEPGQGTGREYVRVIEWAKSNGFAFRWLQRQGKFQLSNISSIITCAVDSREAQVNGVGVWLSFPVAQREGVPCLTRLDLQTTLGPLLSAPKNKPGAAIKSICLDPGHGGKDPGNRVGPYQEKKYTLLLAQEVRKQLARAGFNVTLTRSSDTFVDLPVRPELAKRRNADLFVSLHFNSAENSRTVVRGAEVYCLTPAGASSTNARGEGGNIGMGWCPGNRYNDRNLLLAYDIQKAMTRSLIVDDRGVRRARFAVLRDAAMPAVLIEAGFMSHPEEGRRIFDTGYRQQIARAIVDGVLAYKRTVGS
jgi:N-acetylmuramoyl-L-alanine amidase